MVYMVKGESKGFTHTGEVNILFGLYVIDQWRHITDTSNYTAKRKTSFLLSLLSKWNMPGSYS
jgi:hypothetical protein